ncbi:MAG: hypothetical protein JW882_16570 [Deltaproteobacteria bacterium]|nr:hypothetical protein [Deltaproteobacteria bacterium]
MKTKTDMFLYELTEALRQNGCTLIGHIKGFVNAKDKGHLMFSITSFKEGPRFKGEITGTISSAILTVNIIVYGIGQKNIETIFKKAFDKHFK